MKTSLLFFLGAGALVLGGCAALPAASDANRADQPWGVEPWEGKGTGNSDQPSYSSRTSLTGASATSPNDLATAPAPKTYPGNDAQ